MTTTDPTILELVFNLVEREGGYVNHPADRGGPTKYGVTQKTLDAYRRKHPTTGFSSDVKDLLEPEAARIYAAMYWETPKFNRMGRHRC